VLNKARAIETERSFIVPRVAAEGREGREGRKGAHARLEKQRGGEGSHGGDEGSFAD